MNPYKQLLDLLPLPPLLSGTATVIHSDGTVTVELPGGGEVRVRGVAASGDRVLVKDGEIRGDAPDLPFVLVEE